MADWNYPFSGSKQAAQFLRDEGLSNLPIVACQEAQVAPLSGYLDKPIYYLQSSGFVSHGDPGRSLEELSARQVLTKTLQLARQMHQNVVLVLVYRSLGLRRTGARFASARINADGLIISSSTPGLPSCATIKLLGEFHCCIDELYTVYLIQPDQ